MLRQLRNLCLNPYLLLILSVISIVFSIVDTNLATQGFVIGLLSITMVLIAVRSAINYNLAFSGKVLLANLLLILVSVIWDSLFYLSNLPLELKYSFFIGAGLIRFGIFCYGWLLLAKALATRQKVTDRTIVTAIVGYLFIGIIGSFIYLMIWHLDSHAFHISIVREYELKPWNLAMYFSFTTLTTVGYGDVIPINQWAMALANFEAMIGSFYLTVVLARLVSLFTLSN